MNNKCENLHEINSSKIHMLKITETDSKEIAEINHTELLMKTVTTPNTQNPQGADDVSRQLLPNFQGIYNHCFKSFQKLEKLKGASQFTLG